MNLFFEQVLTDTENLCFYARFAICGHKEYAGKVPFFCQSGQIVIECVKGEAAKLRQNSFNHARAGAAKRLAKRFNRCVTCYRWVCDDCYDTDDCRGACVNCSKKNKNR